MMFPLRDGLIRGGQGERLFRTSQRRAPSAGADRLEKTVSNRVLWALRAARSNIGRSSSSEKKPNGWRPASSAPRLGSTRVGRWRLQFSRRWFVQNLFKPATRVHTREHRGLRTKVRRKSCRGQGGGKWSAVWRPGHDQPCRAGITYRVFLRRGSGMLTDVLAEAFFRKTRGDFARRMAER